MTYVMCVNVTCKNKLGRQNPVSRHIMLLVVMVIKVGTGQILQFDICHRDLAHLFPLSQQLLGKQ